MQATSSRLAPTSSSPFGHRVARLLSSRTGAAATLGTFVLLTRLPALLHPRAIDDEQVYVVVAREMLYGGLPYLSAIERKPPLLFLVYEGILRLAGPANWFALHLVAVLWTLATMGLLYLIARRLFDHASGLAAAFLYPLFLVWADYRGLALNGELMMNLPVAAALAVTLGPGRSRIRPALFLAGALIGLAFLLKQPSGIAGLPLGLYVLRRDYRASRGLSWGHSLLHAALLLLGLVATLGIAALLLARAGILQEALYWTVLAHDVPSGPGSWFFWKSALQSGAFFGLATAPLLLAAAVSLREGFRGHGSWEGHRPELAALLLLLGVSVVGTAAGGQFLYHYYLQLLPALTLLAAPVVARSLTPGAARRPPIVRPAVFGGWLALSAVVFVVVDTLGLARQRAPGASAVYVRNHSTAEDRLFVWGQGTKQTGFYLDADRRPASRYIVTFPLTGHIWGRWDPTLDRSHRIVPGAWHHLQEDFALHPPRYIIDTDAVRRTPLYVIAHYPWLRDYLAAGYLEVYRARDGIVYERRQELP